MHRLTPPLPLLLLCLIATLAAGCGGGGTVDGAAAVPVIGSVEPASGGVAGGTPIVIRGTHLANPVAGEYQVLIGGQPAEAIEVIDDGQVECRTPPGSLGAADVEIVTVEGSGMAPGGFMFYPPPTVASITPNEGTRDGGTPVTVTGTGFTANDPGETVCLIQLKELASVVVVDDTTLTGVTPSSWTETFKDVTVENRNGAGTLNSGFTYVGPTPVIYAVDPAEGSRGGGTLLTITGDYYTEAGGELKVQIGGSDATLVTRIDDQTLTCVTPFTATPGFVDVSVGNNNGASTLPDGFYYIPEPVPLAIVPNEGAFEGGTSVTITGDSFVGGGAVTVLFGESPATNVVVVDGSTITCDTPAAPAIGAVDVVIQNDNGLGTLPDGFTYLAPEFWWEETFGTRLTSAVGWSTYQAVSLPYGFPFYGTEWTSANCVTGGQLQFGAVNVSQYVFDDIQPMPHISALSGLFLVDSSGATSGVYATSHVTDRTILTWDRIPEYPSLGANSFQVHLTSGGIFAIVFKDTTYNIQTGGYGVGIMCGVSRGTTLGASSVTVDWTSGPLSSEAGEAFNQIWQNSQGGDLDNCVLAFYPNEAGGYDTTYTSGVPSDPNP